MSTGQTLETKTREKSARDLPKYAATEEQSERPAILYTSSLALIASVVAFLKNLAVGQRPQPRADDDDASEKLGSSPIERDDAPQLESDIADDDRSDSAPIKDGEKFSSAMKLLDGNSFSSYVAPQQHKAHGSGQLLDPVPLQGSVTQGPAMRVHAIAPVANDNPMPEGSAAITPGNGISGSDDIKPTGDRDIPLDPDLRNRNRPAVVSGAVVFDDLLVNSALIISLSDLLRHASDPDGDKLTVTNLTASSGQVTDNGDGTFRFMPLEGDLSDVTFSYLVSDGQATTPQTALLDLVQRAVHVIAGSDGDDVLLGTPGNDIVTSGSGHNVVRTHPGNDVVYAGARNDVIHTGDGDDLVFGGGGNDSIVSGAGNDIIYGGAGDDTIDGGDGDDVIFGEDGNDTLSGGRGGDNVNGGDGDDTVALEDGNDVAKGGNGDDEISGGTGDDNIEGGDGNDTIWGGTKVLQSTRASAIAGTDEEQPRAGNGECDSAECSHDAQDCESLSGSVSSTPHPPQISDVPQAADADNAERSIVGVSGDDGSLCSDGESAASPEAICDSQFETASAASADDGNDRITGGKGADYVHGGSGNDVLVATPDDGNDVYEGGCGTDTYDLSLTRSAAVVDLREGIASSADTGTDQLIDIENVVGSSQSDTFIANEHQNTFAGGDGDDTYVYVTVESSSADGEDRDVIRDFEVGDKIDVSQIDSDSETEGYQKYEFIGDSDQFAKAGQLRYLHVEDDSGSHTRVLGCNDDDLEEDFSIDIEGVLNLTYDDFIGVWHSS